MTKASRHVWLTALAGVGPRAVAAVALVAAFAVVAPEEGSLDTGQEHAGVPDQGALQDPLGVTGAMGGVRPLTTADAVRLTSDAEELSIPPVALAAYQRSATVLNDADTTCRIDWALVAAIGMVESNHGRHGGSKLGRDGAANPEIIGPQLNGTHGRAEIRDTDDGLYDHDTDYDRAVGPMQFIPSTWTYAGADGDGDNRRDPQDIDDAAVAGAAYLCAGTEDVSTDAGARTAVFRYNQSQTYVDTVLKIADQYRNGEYPGAATVDGGSPSTLRPTATALPPKNVRAEKPVAPKPQAEEPDEEYTVKAAPAPVTPKPTSEPTSGATEGDSSDDKTDPPATEGPTEDPSKEPSDGASETPDPTDDPTPNDPSDTEEPETPESICETAVALVYPTLVPTEGSPENPRYQDVVDECVENFPSFETADETAAIAFLFGLRATDGWADLPTPDENAKASDAEAETTQAP